MWFIGVFFQVSPNKASEWLWISLILLIGTRDIWVETGGFSSCFFVSCGISNIPNSTVTKECCWTVHWGLDVEMINEKYKKTQNTAVTITTTGSSAVNCLEGIDQRNFAEQQPKFYIKKVRKQGVNQGLVLPGPGHCSAVCCIIHIFHPKDSFLWGREQQKKMFSSFSGFSTTQGIVSHLQIVFGSPASIIFWLWYHKDRKNKGRKMLMLI